MVYRLKIHFPEKIMNGILPHFCEDYQSKLSFRKGRFTGKDKAQSKLSFEGEVYR